MASRLRLVILACIVFVNANGAGALTLSDIEKIYNQKLEQLGDYRLTYRSTTETHARDQPDSVQDRRNVLLVSDGGYRLESSNIETASPVIIKTDDRNEHRTLMFSDSGNPVSGLIVSSRRISLYGSLVYTPVGLSGLHGKFAAGFDTARFMSDIAALAADPRSKLVADAVSLDGETMYVVEWPGEAEHTLFRFWLSAEKNLALVKYESYFANNGYQVYTRVLNSGFVEVAPDLFLPNESVFEVLPVAEDKRSQTITVKLESCALDVEVASTDFRVDFPLGVIVQDETIDGWVPFLIIVVRIFDQKRRKSPKIQGNK